MSQQQHSYTIIMVVYMHFIDLFIAGVQIMFSAPTLTVSEDSNQPTLCVQHMAIVERQFSVSVAFEDVTTSLEDFNHTSLEIVFDADSENIQHFQLISIDDLLEVDEVFRALLSTADEDVDIVNGILLVTITDSSALEVGFTNSTFTVEEGDSVSVCVAIFSGHLAQGVQLPLIIVPSIRAQGRMTIVNVFS